MVDPFYIAQIEAFPLPEIDWDSLEEDDLQVLIELVIVKTKNWLKEKRQHKVKV